MLNQQNTKIRKPYTITKSREKWTDEEQQRFIEALKLFHRDWKKIEEYVGSKTVIQIRSHAQKYFLKLQKNDSSEHVPPSRPKRKTSHPYPLKASKTASVPVQMLVTYPSGTPGYTQREVPSSMLVNTTSNVSTLTQVNRTSIPVVEGTSVAAGNGSSSCKTSLHSMLSTSGTSRQWNQDLPLQTMPNFAVVYTFIGSVFDPDTTGDHMEKLKEMDPIDVETVVLLMRNLTINLCSPENNQLLDIQ